MFQVPSRETRFSLVTFGNSQAIADFEAKVKATEAEVADYSDEGWSMTILHTKKHLK